MDNEPNSPDSSTALSRERTREAADRTLMAWIRTALSLISFGVGIGQFVALLNAAFPEKHLDQLRASLVVATSLVILGMLSLLGAIIQYRLILKALEQADYAYNAPLALTLVVAILLLVIGLFSLVGIMLS
jgi:putative membrane protein